MTHDTIKNTMRETIQHIQEVGKLLLQVIQELQQRTIKHDLSKFSEEEFNDFAKSNHKLKSIPYGSKEYAKSLKSINNAITHHYKYNDHHPQYFKNGIHDMDLIQLIELLADWYASSKRYKDGSLVNSIIHNQTRFNYNKQLTMLLAKTAYNMKWISKKDLHKINQEIK